MTPVEETTSQKHKRKGVSKTDIKIIKKQIILILEDMEIKTNMLL